VKRTIPCTYYNVCGNVLDPRAPGIYIEIQGWHRLREDGGQNAVYARKETGRVACEACGWKIRNGIDPLQLEAFPT